MGRQVPATTMMMAVRAVVVATAVEGEVAMAAVAIRPRA